LEIALHEPQLLKNQVTVQTYRSLCLYYRFNHHATVDQLHPGHSVASMTLIVAHQADLITPVVPPAAAFRICADSTCVQVVVSVNCAILHAVVSVVKSAVVEHVFRVSAVPGHVQSVLVTVAGDLELPVLC